MITLNSDRGLVQIEVWSEIETRPGFVKDLDPTIHKLKAIIGRYIFPETIRCGLSNCHTPHAKGYIVATEDGHETNIGKDCGKTYFGVDFEIMSRKFDEDVTAAQNRETLASFGFQLENLEARIKALRSADRGADWVYRHTRPLLSAGRGCPDEVVRQIDRMVRARNPEVIFERRAREEEVEQIEIQERRTIERPHYITESAGSIVGLEALYAENDLRELLVLDLQERLSDFRALSIASLTQLELKRWTKWVATVEGTLTRAETAVAAGQRLLSAEGLQPFLDVLPSQDHAQFRTYLRSLRNQA